MTGLSLRIAALITLVVTIAPLLATEIPTGGFQLEKSVEVPGTPEQVYDLFTGDVIEWWDHHHAEKPRSLYIDARPGGHFFEMFDDEGNGAIHATVIYADRGKRLRFAGPLGFSGYGLDLIHSFEFEAVGGEHPRTRLSLTVRGVGQVEEGWEDAVDRVWDHFLIERFKAYVESRSNS